MKKFFRKKWVVVLYFVLLGMTACFIGLTLRSGENYKFAQEDEIQFETSWSYVFSDGTTGITELPAKLSAGKVDTLTLTNTIPVLDRDTCFIVRARHVLVKIYMDGELIYDQTAGDKAALRATAFPLPGNVWNEIPLRREDSGKQITMVATGIVQRYLKSPGEVYLGDRASFQLELLRVRAGTMMGAIVLFILAFILLILWVILTYSTHARYNECLCLALFTFSVSLWEFTETRCIQFVLPNMKAVSLIAYELLPLAPAPIALFFSYGKRERTTFLAKIAAGISLFVWIFNNVLHFFHIMDISETLIISQIMIAFETVFIGYIQISDVIADKRVADKGAGGVFWWVPLLGLGMLAPLLLLEVFKYMFDSTAPNWDDALFPTIGIIFYIIALAIHSGLKLAAENFMANEASRAKSQFLANMSHEIRTPLNAILGFDELILRDAKEKKVEEYALSIQSAGESLCDIINMVLDLSKIEAGKLEIESAEYSLEQMLDNVVSMERAMANQKGLFFKVDIDEQLPKTLVGDVVRVRQVLVNILTNAVKYTKKGGVTFVVKLVSWRKEEGTCEILFSVRDTGIGIRDEDKERIFEKFERLDLEKNRNTEGTGLGMSIVVKLLNAMDSRIELSSNYGEGSDFYFTLKQKIAGDTDCIGMYEAEGTKKEVIKTAQEHFTAPDAKILVVDDVNLNLKVTRALLEELSMQIDTAESGAKAIEMVKKVHYDIILMDHMMPQMDGIVATKKIRDLAENTGDSYYRQVPILALTANALAGMREMFLEHDMQDFIRKPVRGELLKAIIKKWLPREKVKEMEAVIKEDWDIKIPGIDVTQAKPYFSTRKMYEETLYDFYRAISDNREKIKTFVEKQDEENYTVWVHALKSSARLIGALELSKEAERLELLAHEGAYERVWKDNNQLLLLYEECERALREYLPKEDVTERQMDKQELKNALQKLEQIAENFDMMGLLEWQKQMEHTNAVDVSAEEWKKLKVAVQKIAFSEILVICKKILA